MTHIRNPLASFALTGISALGLSIVAALPTLFVSVWELKLIVLSFALVGVGAVAGRSSIIGSMGFVGSFVGGFVGILAFQFTVWPTGGWEYMLALYYGGLCGLGGLVTGKLGLRRVEKAAQEMPHIRRCQHCGAKVGLSARKCWSCRASLPQN